MHNKKVNRANKLNLSGLGDKTLAYLRTIERYNNDPIVPRRSGQSSVELLRWDEAERELLSAVKLAPESSTVYKFLGLLYLEKREFEKAEQYFKKSIAKAISPDVLTLLGVTRYRLDKLQLARRAFHRAIDTDPNYKEAYYNLALTLTYIKHSKAIKLFQKAVDLDPKYAAARRELGGALKHIGQYSDAERHLRRAIKLDNTDGWAYLYLGTLMWRKLKPIEAEQAFKMAITTWPNEGTPYWCLADFYKHHGRLKKAEGLYKKAVQLDPDSSVAHSRLGLYLKQIGERIKAKRYLERALSLDPNFERVKAALDELKREDM